MRAIPSRPENLYPYKSDPICGEPKNSIPSDSVKNFFRISLGFGLKLSSDEPQIHLDWNIRFIRLKNFLRINSG